MGLAPHTLVGNDASAREAEWAEFTREGILRAYEIVRGEPTDIVIYALLRADPGQEAAPGPDAAPDRSTS